ncbi:hypothetical protein [Nocardia suismassiliense]|uniref:hypothetical protein n=1 Tax=Nocardia suismassiliense TaxID=2077092 RepID=UPI000D1F4697|nr:hypothetical protein [Nocardia suismassiliense]
MRIPTPPQRQVLTALHDHCAHLAALLTEAARHRAGTGERPPQSWYRDYQEHAILREALEQVAAAGGVPRAWISHVHEHGSTGTPWPPDIPLRPPDPVDWDRVLGPLCTDVARLQEWTALDLARRADSPDRGFGAAAFDHNLAVLRARTTGIANLLGLDTDLGEQLWGDVQDWAHTGVAVLDGLSAEQVIDRWNIAACTDTGTYTLHASALRAAEIALDATPALPAHEHLVAALTHALPSLHARDETPSPGVAIASALTAADGSETSSETALFSCATEVDPWGPDGDPDRDIPIPIFASHAEGLER